MLKVEYENGSNNYLDDASQTHLLRRSAPCVGWGQPRGLLLGLADGEIHESVNDDETSR